MSFQDELNKLDFEKMYDPCNSNSIFFQVHFRGAAKSWWWNYQVPIGAMLMLKDAVYEVGVSMR